MPTHERSPRMRQRKSRPSRTNSKSLPIPLILQILHGTKLNAGAMEKGIVWTVLLHAPCEIQPYCWRIIAFRSWALSFRADEYSCLWSSVLSEQRSATRHSHWVFCWDEDGLISDRLLLWEGCCLSSQWCRTRLRSLCLLLLCSCLRDCWERIRQLLAVCCFLDQRQWGWN